MRDDHLQPGRDPLPVDWGPVGSDLIEPKVIPIVTSGAADNWSVRSCPWWLKAARDERELILCPRNCGRFGGRVRLDVNGQPVHIHVRSHLRRSARQALRVGIKVFLTGLAAVVLSACLGLFCGLAVPLLGGPVGVAIAGIVFCAAWGGLVGGRRLAVQSCLAGEIALPLAAGVVVVLLMVGSGTIGDLAAFRVSMSVAGVMVGTAVGITVGGRRVVATSAAVGLGAWLMASVLTVPIFKEQQGVGATVFLALLVTPALGLTIWGTAMAALLAPIRRIDTK